MAAEWEMSDSWVFAEGRSIDDGYALTQVIAKGDGINHTILTAIPPALRRLDPPQDGE
jgi:hypothetical protein